MSNAGDFSWSWILKDFIQVQKEGGKFNQYVPFADAIIFSLKTSFSDFHRILFLPLQIKKVYTNNTIYERAIVTGLRYVSN